MPFLNERLNATAARVLAGDESLWAARELECAVLDEYPDDERLDDLLEALALYGAPKSAGQVEAPDVRTLVQQALAGVFQSRSPSRRPGATDRVRVHEYTSVGVRRREDRLATEEPLEVRLSWPGHAAERVGVTMRTPGHDFELAAGMLHAEGLLEPSWVHQVNYCTDTSLTPEQEFNVVTVDLDRAPVRRPASRYDGPKSAASACGVCGTQSIDEVLALCDVRRPAENRAIEPATLLALPDCLRAEQQVFARTGGLHAAGLFDATGSLLVLREDIGRHNAVDKVVGARILAGQPVAAPVLCVSGRIGFEIVQKAAAAGIGVVAAIGAPSSLAVRLAKEADLCLVGFLTERRFVTYSAPARIGSG